MALVRAWNTRRQHWQDVPAHYIESPHIFPGVFVAQPPAEPTPEPPVAAKKKSRRKSGTAENTPATKEAAATNEPTPLAGDENKE